MLLFRRLFAQKFQEMSWNITFTCYFILPSLHRVFTESFMEITASPLAKWSETQFGQISVLIFAHDKTVPRKPISVLGVVAHASRPSSWEREAHSGEPGQPWLHRNCEAWAKKEGIKERKRKFIDTFWLALSWGWRYTVYKGSHKGEFTSWLPDIVPLLSPLTSTSVPIYLDRWIPTTPIW